MIDSKKNKHTNKKKKISMHIVGIEEYFMEQPRGSSVMVLLGFF